MVYVSFNCFRIIGLRSFGASKMRNKVIQDAQILSLIDFTEAVQGIFIWYSNDDYDFQKKHVDTDILPV